MVLLSLEVGLQPIGALNKISPQVTDLDVMASLQAAFEGVKNMVFDYARQKAMNRR
jgi:hypothetical protein